MKTKATLLIVALAAALVLPRLVAEEKDKLNGAKCPVSGKPAKEASSVEYRGAKVYFCCDGCPESYNKDKAKFATKSNHQLVVTGQAKQIKCPLTEKDLNNDTQIEVSGAKVTFCCNNCKGKVGKAKDDEKLELVFAEKAFDKGFKVEKSKK
jgi:YHS domain-containing protein